MAHTNIWPATALLASLFAAQAGEQTATLQEEKVDLQDRVEALEATVAQTTAYLQSQAKAQGDLVKALAESESAGFTYGINPESREILLKGLRDQAQAAQTSVPGTEETAEPGDGGRRR